MYIYRYMKEEVEEKNELKGEGVLFLPRAAFSVNWEKKKTKQKKKNYQNIERITR